MSVTFAESVAITKSRLKKGFNGDNLNLNGKVVSVQEADNGFKAAGRVKPPYIAVVASGNQKGFAAGAVSAFNDYVKDINLNKYNSEAVIARYFDDMQAVIDKCDIEGSKLSVGIVCAYDDCVVAAKTGDCHLLRFSEGELFEIALSDEEGGRGYQFIDVVTDGDMFALIGEEASADLDYDGIVGIFDSDSDLKTKVKAFYKLLAEKAQDNDCSVVLVKLECDTERTYASAPLVSTVVDAEDDGSAAVSPESFESEPAVETAELYKADETVSDDENPETGKKPKSTKKKILDIIPILVLIAILGVAAALFIATRFSSPVDGVINKPEKTTKETTTAETVIDDETEIDVNGSSGMQDVEDVEHGGDVVTPENTTTATENTTVATENTTVAEETTTATENTTVPVENTTVADETTTSAAENPEQTTQPIVDDPGVDEPVVDDPGVDEPVVDDPVVDEPVVDEPVIDDPIDNIIDDPEDPDYSYDHPSPDEPVDDPLVD